MSKHWSHTKCILYSRYYDETTIGLNFEGMLADLKSYPPETFVLLHGKLCIYCSYFSQQVLLDRFRL